MKNILKRICNDKKKELEITKSKCSLNSLIKSSPSAGELIKDYHPENIAYQYEKSDAGSISILTESNYFKGSIDHISLIRNVTNLPILRKDFIIDIYQIYESKVFKADAILLIASILSDKKIKEFINIANDLGLDCIIETHSKDELNRAIKIKYPIIGVNNRNLKDLSVDTNNTLNLIKDLTKDFNIIGESGIKTHLEIKSYNHAGVYNFLVGESILKAPNIKNKFIELLNR